MMTARQIVVGYLVSQTVVVAAWWALLLFVPRTISWFQAGAWPPETLLCFWLPDSILLVFGSLVTAFAIGTERLWSKVSIWALAAASWYPALYCIGVSMRTDEAWLASAMMVSMAGLTLAMATIHGSAEQQPATIRATEMTKVSAICWTLAQTIIFWGVFLWIFPKGIVELEHRIGFQSFSHVYQSLAAFCLFAAASVLGLLSGINMAAFGAGTPLPTATAPKLVVAGPYGYVRNPMALAGIVQGVAVGWYLGSISVILYSISGAFVWHLFVRPVEEADLQSRFGERYMQYKDSVRLWCPSLRRYEDRVSECQGICDGQPPQNR